MFDVLLFCHERVGVIIFNNKNKGNEGLSEECLMFKKTYNTLSIKILCILSVL